MSMIVHPSKCLRSPLVALFLSASAGILAGCPAKPPAVAIKSSDGTTADQPKEATEAEEQAAGKMASDADAQEKQGNATAAEQSRDELLRKYPSTLPAARIYDGRAKAASEAGKTDDAIAQYELLLFNRPNYERADAVREEYAALLIDRARFDDAEKMLTSLYRSAKTPADKERLGDSLVVAQTGANHSGDALGVLVDLSNLAGLPEGTRRSMSERALTQVASNLSFSETERMWSQSEGRSTWAFLQPALAYKLAKIYYHTRDYNHSEDMLNLIISRFGSSTYANQARDFLGHLRARFEVDAHAIGVILPLTGKYEQYGKRSLQAINQAFGHGPYKLVVKDTQGEANLASQAVETLVLENHVIAVIGPIFSGESMAAALKAEELSIPLLSLSHREGLTGIGPFVFRTALTVSAQAKALAKIAFEDLGLTRFALLYPRHSYGQGFVAAFWDEVDRRHGEIRGAEAYDPDQTTFREPVRRLVGRWYLGARSDYREALDALRKQKLTPMRMRSELEKLDKTLPPVVDFDAIIIPDSGRQIGLIAPALAFEDVVLTHDPKILEKIRKSTKAEPHPVTLLGGSTWNTSQTVDSCEAYCEGSVFVDAYFPNSPDAKVRDFIAGFREANAGAEPLLQEAEAYDTGGLLKMVLGNSKAESRKALREALSHSGVYQGVTGKVSFDGEGEAHKDLFVLTIKDHSIRLYERPPEPPRG